MNRLIFIDMKEGKAVFKKRQPLNQVEIRPLIQEVTMLRLDRFLCEMKNGSRSEVKELIRKGNVTVNQKVEKSPDRKVDENRDLVCVNGNPVSYRKFVYVLLYKPAGLLSATTDRDGQTVLDWVREKGGTDLLLQRELAPVGRLDKDTEGLLLLTDDGDLTHRLLSPARHVEKTYYVEINGLLTKEDRDRLESGVDIGDEEPTRPARICPAGTGTGIPSEYVNSASESAWLLTITEGRFHQVKRMMKAVGTQVVYLRRVSMGPLNLEGLPEPGLFRYLTREEEELLGC